jgi:hypothetical protein
MNFRARRKIVLIGSLLMLTSTSALGDNSEVYRGALAVVQSGDIESSALDYVTQLTLSSMNQGMNQVTHQLLGERLKHLEFSLGLEEGRPSINGSSVYGIYETKNWFVFNQTSIVGHDSRTTLNFGIGVRRISSDDTIILGVNAFHDYEFGSDHRRVGFGAEVLTSLLQVRANYYKAVSGETTYKGAQEAALDGHDIKFSYELPFFYSSNMFITEADWYDDTGYRTSYTKVGASAELIPNMYFSVASERKDNEASDISASITYNVKLGGKQPNRVAQDGVFRLKLGSVRHLLYTPVQRENRIVKKVARIGVTVSGY